MNGIVNRLIAKELHVHRGMMLATATAAALSALACAFGRVAFNVGSIAWITAVIAGGVMLAIYGVANERKEQSLQFILSLPVSVPQYVLAKTLGLLLCFALPWLAATLSAVALVLASPAVPDGMLPFVVALCGYLLANFAIVLCAALHARSEGAMTAAIILTNMSVSIFMFVVGALPGIRAHLDADAPVWNGSVLGVLLVEALVLVFAVALPQLTVARRRDFL
ncbi:ABC transporter permease [Luteimonas sp. SDU101]|uniref:ABC transporter permease n=1 Tax=unclassified Luteimonas TaxID=2629088 RepID=UPI003EB98098